MKYQYWHLIKKSYDKRFSVGEVVSNRHKMDYKNYELFNLKTGKSKVVCEVEYVCRTPKDWSSDKKAEFIKSKLKPPTTQKSKISAEHNCRFKKDGKIHKK